VYISDIGVNIVKIFSAQEVDLVSCPIVHHFTFTVLWHLGMSCLHICTEIAEYG